MAFDVVYHPDTGIKIFLGVVFIGKISSTSGADSPILIRFLCCWVGFCFLLRFGFFFKILGENSDRDVDLSLSLSLPLLSFVLTSLVPLRRFVILVLRFP